MALGVLISFRNLGEAPAAGIVCVDEFFNLPNHMRPAGGGAFPLPSMVGLSPSA
jgi:hypothetical protein